MARNTTIFVGALAIFATVVVGVNLGRASLPHTNTDVTPTQTPNPTPKPTGALLLYTDPTCQVSLQYPDSMVATRIETGGAIFTDPGSKESLSLLCQKSFPKPTGPDMTVNVIPVGSISASLYNHVQSSEGTYMDKLIFTHPKNKLQIYLAGPTRLMDLMTGTLSL